MSCKSLSTKLKTKGSKTRRRTKTKESLPSQPTLRYYIKKQQQQTCLVGGVDLKGGKDQASPTMRTPQDDKTMWQSSINSYFGGKSLPSQPTLSYVMKKQQQQTCLVGAVDLKGGKDQASPTPTILQDDKEIPSVKTEPSLEYSDPPSSVVDSALADILTKSAVLHNDNCRRPVVNPFAKLQSYEHNTAAHFTSSPTTPTTGGNEQRLPLSITRKGRSLKARKRKFVMSPSKPQQEKPVKQVSRVTETTKCVSLSRSVSYTPPLTPSRFTPLHTTPCRRLSFVGLESGASCVHSENKDMLIRSHDKSRDHIDSISEKSHDNRAESHDHANCKTLSFSECDTNTLPEDQLGQSHVSHDMPGKSHDVINESHDTFNQSHDSFDEGIKQSHHTSIDALIYQHDDIRVQIQVSPEDTVQINPSPEWNKDHQGSPCVIDGSNEGSVIVSPDMSTTIATSITCPRRSACDSDGSVCVSVDKVHDVKENIWSPSLMESHAVVPVSKGGMAAVCMSSPPRCLPTQHSCLCDIGSIKDDGGDIQQNLIASIHLEHERQEIGGNGGTRVWRESITRTDVVMREAQEGLPSSQRKSQTVSDQQLLLQESPSHYDNGRRTHPANDDVISKCDDVTTIDAIDATKGSETITSSEHSSQEGSQALMPRTTSSKYANIRTVNSDLGLYTMTSPPQDSAEDDTSSKNDVCKTYLEAPTNDMLPADMTFYPRLSSHEQSSSIDSKSSPHSKVSNLPATVDHCCQGHQPELCVHENPLILSLDPTTGPTSNQDKCEDSLTYSHETQILLPTSGTPIDPHNTREYIPTCFTPVATLSQCTHDGRWYYDEHNDFGLEIPAGATPKGESITIDIGVALYGPFQYPEGLRPVSPVFWVCVCDQKDFQFLKPIKLTIPHCLNLKQYDDIESLGLTFLKGDHEMNPQQMYQFQQAEGDVLIEPLKTHAVIKITHFCSLCFSCKERRDLFEKEIFCLYSVIPCKISPDQPSDAYFFITLRLKTCLTTVKKQIKELKMEEHKQEKEKFQFSNVQELEMFLPQTLPAEWRVGMRGKKKILMKDVDFFVKEFCETTREELEVDEEEGMYPPRFHVVLSCSPSARENQTRIEFRGATSDLVFDIFLTPSVPSTRSLPILPSGGIEPQVPDVPFTRPAAPRTRGMSITSSYASEMDSRPRSASGCSSTHEQDGPTPLGIDDLFDVTSELEDVAVSWRGIGLALRLRDPDLGAIAVGDKSVYGCLTDMLRLWLTQCYDVKYGEPSWQMLENAVRARVGGNNPAVADQIQRKCIT